MKAFPLLFALLSPALIAETPDLAWPEATREAKPWTRWWWLGSGVDAPNLTRELEAFAAAGIGGVEICPIYGAKGYESRDLPFLSPEWMDAYQHTATETARLGLGLDLTTGTGWPFGGPWVDESMASKQLQWIRHETEGGQKLELKLPAGTLQHLAAWPEDGPPVNLMESTKDGRLSWNAPDGKWRIFGIAHRSGIQKVKRAAPGGAGFVVDPFSPDAIARYFKPFESAFQTSGATAPRAHFHDSFEYYGADFTPDLLDRFAAQHHYELRDQLPALAGEGDADTVARVRADYRQTLDELHRLYLKRWHAWAVEHGSLTRNQAHGSPGSLLDHYAVADIPETEIFRHTGDEQIPMLQFASSAANLTGKNLVSAESFTWLEEHFQVTPKDLKEAADFLWLGGVNHLFFHGIPYTPEDAGWPGWLFYASTHMGPNGGLWKDLPAFTDYIIRCQSILQEGQPDHEVLMYFPVHDLWQQSHDKPPLFTIHNQNEWLHPTGFHEVAMKLWNEGIPCDYASDRLLQSATASNGRINLGKGSYKVLIVPDGRYLPTATAEFIQKLAENGVKLIEIGQPARDVPGFHDLESKREVLAKATAAIRAASGYQSGSDVVDLLRWAAITPEPMAKAGLRFVRRKHDKGHHYFVVNRSGRPFDGSVALAVKARSVVMMDPRRPQRTGVADSRLRENRMELRLVLAPGESRILRTFSDHGAKGPAWHEPEPAGPPITLAGEWKTEFTEGGPELPEPFNSTVLGSWTTRPDPKAAAFSGTARYTLTFQAGAGASRHLLNLGDVAHTARVRLNGHEIGASWSPPHTFVLDHPGDANHTLEVEVTNLAANRIADLDRRKVPWKAFHEINFVNIDYKPFDASNWTPLPSGLFGPVTLTPLK